MLLSDPPPGTGEHADSLQSHNIASDGMDSQGLWPRIKMYCDEHAKYCENTRHLNSIACSLNSQNNLYGSTIFAKASSRPI